MLLLLATNIPDCKLTTCSSFDKNRALGHGFYFIWVTADNFGIVCLTRYIYYYPKAIFPLSLHLVTAMLAGAK
ncbi:MAG: hypothetical protein H6Q74_1856 [Firmicutes bacterium]|nr:hypothetical protein [Bacillota bacterium]